MWKLSQIHYYQQLMVPQILTGIDGLKDLKIHQVADACYGDTLSYFHLLETVEIDTCSWSTTVETYFQEAYQFGGIYIYILIVFNSVESSPDLTCGIILGMLYSIP